MVIYKSYLLQRKIKCPIARERNAKMKVHLFKVHLPSNLADYLCWKMAEFWSVLICHCHIGENTFWVTDYQTLKRRVQKLMKEGVCGWQRHSIGVCGWQRHSISNTALTLTLMEGFAFAIVMFSYLIFTTWMCVATAALDYIRDFKQQPLVELRIELQNGRNLLCNVTAFSAFLSAPVSIHVSEIIFFCSSGTLQQHSIVSAATCSMSPLKLMFNVTFYVAWKSHSIRNPIVQTEAYGIWIGFQTTYGCSC